MKRFGFIYLTFLFFFISSNCIADVFTEVDTNGATIFSDKPLSDKSTRINKSELNQTSTIESRSPETIEQQPSNKESVTKNELKKPYTAFKMSSPVDQETIQNQPTI